MLARYRYDIGEILKRPTRTDCKSVDLCLHRFESCSPHYSPWVASIGETLSVRKSLSVHSDIVNRTRFSKLIFVVPVAKAEVASPINWGVEYQPETVGR